MIEVLLFYLKNRAKVIHFDAIAYLWKEIGTNCINLRQTHDFVKLFCKILDLIAPEVLIITEANVPHKDNISYFGDSKDEAHIWFIILRCHRCFYAFAI